MGVPNHVVLRALAKYVSAGFIVCKGTSPEFKCECIQSGKRKVLSGVVADSSA